jgi:hypothetical protein
MVGDVLVERGAGRCDRLAHVAQQRTAKGHQPLSRRSGVRRRDLGLCARLPPLDASLRGHTAPRHSVGPGLSGRRDFIDDQTSPLEFFNAVFINVADDVAIGDLRVLDQIGSEIPLGFVHRVRDDMFCLHDLPPRAAVLPQTLWWYPFLSDGLEPT